ncbi:MAG: alpha/beta fold hydrolase [Bacteroidota bacterium]
MVTAGTRNYIATRAGPYAVYFNLIMNTGFSLVAALTLVMKKRIIILISLIFSLLPPGIYSQSAPPGQSGYWNLPTGSKIAYCYFKGREPRKPTPVIYLHGGPGGYVTPGDTAVFGRLADDGFDVYLYDQVGGGKSARLENIREYTVDRHVRDLEAIVELTGAAKVIIIGHSWGASLAPLYLAGHPGRVEKLIFSGPGGMVPKKFDLLVPAPDSVKLKNRERRRHSVTEYLDPAGLKRYNKICSRACSGLKAAADNEADSLLDCLMMNKSRIDAKDQGLAVTMKPGGHSGAYSNIRTGMFITRGKDRRKILSEMNIPVLILLGESDNLPWACVADYLHVFKNIKLTIIPGSGHSVFAFQPELCLKLAREFLSLPGSR